MTAPTPDDRASGAAPAADPAGAAEPRRPFLMDPAGDRPSGFAPPAALADRESPADRRPGGGAPPSPWAPGTARSPRPGRPHTPSVLAGPTPVGRAEQNRPDPVAPARAESSFGPVSRIVTVSIRTPSSRIDLALPDRTTLAEVLETVLDLAPRSLREEALAHGGWILRTSAGRPLPGSTTLLDEGIAGGATLFLTGADAADPAVVHDDLADTVAEVVRADPAAWPDGAGRAVALGACGAFGALALVAVLALGPPWIWPSVILAGLAIVGQVAAGLVARRRGDCGIALTVGLLSVAAGAAAATVAAAGSTRLSALGPGPWLLGTVTAGVLAGTASLAVGARRVPFGAVITATGLLAVAGAGGAAFDLGPLGTAALVAGLAVCLMPVLPSLSLRLAAFESDPVPTTPQELDTAARRTVDAGDARTRARRAVRFLTAFIHGLAWPALAAGVVLSFGAAPAGRALVAVVALALLLRARLFRTVGQRLPLLVAGLGSLLAVPVGVVLRADSTDPVAVVIVAAVAAVAVAAVVAGRRIPRTPAMARAAEIADLLLTIAVIPLVAAVLGAFAFVRGLGG